MLNKNKITKDEHFNFIESLKDESSKQYFPIDDIGVIYFTNIKDNTAEIGLYSNPIKYRVGKILMDKLLLFKYKTLKLEVFSDNKKAINLYKGFKFKESGEKMIDNQKVICMELENESNN